MGNSFVQVMISVIVVNYNGGEYLRKCIASLVVQSFKDFEVIIIDNGSSDGSIESLPSLPGSFRTVRLDSNLGFAAANNLGASLASGSWLALLNPDATASPRWLECLLEAVTRRPNYRIVASAQFKMDCPEKLDGVGDCYSIAGFAWRGGYGHSRAEMPPAGETFAACGASAFYPKEAFLAAGGFDERFFCYVEDVDLGFRLRLLGERCQFDPKCWIEHAGSAIAGAESPFTVFHSIRNTIWTALKNLPLGLILFVAPLCFVATSMLYLKASKEKRLSLKSGLKAALVGLGPILIARRRIQRQRVISAAAVARAISWNLRMHRRHLPDVRPFT